MAQAMELTTPHPVFQVSSLAPHYGDSCTSAWRRETKPYGNRRTLPPAPSSRRFV